ncbi:MAG: hypothetical protein AAGC71_01675 [Pseudomonadota bacterium]
MSRLSKIGWLVAALSALTACGGGTSEVVPSDAVITALDPLGAARAAYGVTASRPADFFNDMDPYPDRLTLTAHVRSAVVDPANASDADLCRDGSAEALALTERHAATFAAAPVMVATDSTPWYFETSFDLQAIDPTVLRSRVFRCSALDRDALDAAVLARLNRTPLDLADVKFAIEYLWTFSPDNTALQAVLSSVTRRSSDGFEHELVRVVVEKFAGSDSCDRLTVWRDVYEIDLEDRLLVRTQSPEETFDARFIGGDAELCAD